MITVLQILASCIGGQYRGIFVVPVPQCRYFNFSIFRRYSLPELKSRPKFSRPRQLDFDFTRPRRNRDLEQKVETRPRLERSETETRQETFGIRGSQKAVNILTANRPM